MNAARGKGSSELDLQRALTGLVSLGSFMGRGSFLQSSLIGLQPAPLRTPLRGIEIHFVSHVRPLSILTEPSSASVLTY